MTEHRSYRHWRLEYDAANIAWLHVDKEGTSTNVLSSEVLEELHTLLSPLTAHHPRALVVLSDKPSGFIAGADIKEFTQIESHEQALEFIRLGQSIFNRIEALPFPTVAQIKGFCVGGGLELALACRYRVAQDDPRTRLGQPEVNLGIHPGFGGTVRLNRLIGAPAAMDLMLSGRTVDVRTAARLGIVDHAVPERHLRAAALSLVNTTPKPRKPGFLTALARHDLVRPRLANYLRRRVAKRVASAHYPAPYALIELWREHGGDERRMLEEEAKSVARLVTDNTARNLVRVFFLNERLKSLGRKQDFAVRKVHVIGAGTMGGDIAAWCALQGLEVTLQDREPRYIAPALKRAHDLFSKRIRDRRLRQSALDRLVPDHKALGLPQADVIIEAIIEDTEAKRTLFQQIEPRLKPDAILATNTSSIPLESLQEALRQPERLIGVHFFNPVAKMQLVEVIATTTTDKDVLKKGFSFVRTIDRLPLPVKSSPGFLVNRILMPYMMEAVFLLSEGAPVEAIDQAAREFGMPMGPLELADTVGLDICLSVGEILAKAIGTAVPEGLREMVQGGQLGRKSGQGFYEYRKGKPKRRTDVKATTPLSEIADRLIQKILDEARACLREEVVEDADLLDAGMVFGTGFAPFRGGPMHYAAQRSAA